MVKAVPMSVHSEMFYRLLQDRKLHILTDSGARDTLLGL